MISILERLSFGRSKGGDNPTTGRGLFLAIYEFKQRRGEFYSDLAGLMTAQPGKNIRELLEPYVERYGSMPEGKLAAYWLQRMDEDVATFSEALVGTVPSEDLTVLVFAERAGDLKIGLEQLSENIRGMEDAKKVARTVLFTAVAAVVIFHIFLGVEGFVLMPRTLKSIGGMIPPERWGPVGKVFYGLGEIIRGWGWALILLEMLVFGWVKWSFPNYVGRFRPWLDRHFLPYQFYRDFRGAAFLSSLGAGTVRVGTQVQTVPDVLEKMEAEAYPWLKWHIKRILNNFEHEPNSKGEAFNTGIVNDRAYYRIVDIAEYSDMSTMLSKVGEIVRKAAPAEMEKKATIVRYIVVVIVIVMMLGMYFGTFKMADEFKAIIQLNMMMRG
jgi:type II secretory pathway component PulF